MSLNAAQRARVIAVLARRVKPGETVGLSQILAQCERNGIDPDLAAAQVRAQPQFRVIRNGRGYSVIRTSDLRKLKPAGQPVATRRTTDVEDSRELLLERADSLVRRTSVDEPIYPQVLTAWALLDIARTLSRTLP